ncbi:sodium:calcium antiporter [Microvirga splendida]|uniref:Sodium:calcium antiporter n=1 Tax=Microvirga splendida TaxID=2795727 RepID=A0ABS0Y3Y1_9HYPH|nr:sodium:calcium antiporter [Microvirga splendida]MBJ6127014.1 sodium:calcium antiporter [Microvirga splendida]
MLAFANWSISVNLLLFAVSAAAVWAAGTRLAGYVDGIAQKTGLGQAFTGMLLLGGITSLAEISTVTTSAYTGNAALAVNNLLGSAAINVLLLAIADAVLGREALTTAVAKPATLLQGVLGIILLAVLSAIIVAGDIGVAHVGLGSCLLLLLCIGSIWLASGYEHRHVWTVVGAEKRERKQDTTDSAKSSSLQQLTVKTAVAAAVIVVAGFFLSQTADALAQKTGIGAGLVGLVLIGFATSLPELSSIVAALRHKRYELAMGDIFGTNLFNIALIFLADVAYTGGPVLREAGPFEAVASLLALVLTGIFILGLLERKNRTILRMGYDSLTAIVVFACGLVALYFLTPNS